MSIFFFLSQTYIGSILVAINPYKTIQGLYDKVLIEQYNHKNIGELPPHIFAIANDSYYSMWKRNENQVVLIRQRAYVDIELLWLCQQHRQCYCQSSSLIWSCPEHLFPILKISDRFFNIYNDFFHVLHISVLNSCLQDNAH